MNEKENIQKIIKSFFDIKFFGAIYGKDQEKIVNLLKELLDKEYIEYVFISANDQNLEQELDNIIIEDYTILIISNSENISIEALKEVYNLYKKFQSLSIILVGNYDLKIKIQNLENKNISKSLNFFLEFKEDTNKNKFSFKFSLLIIPVLIFALLFSFQFFTDNEKKELKTDNIKKQITQKTENINTIKNFFYKSCDYVNLENYQKFSKLLIKIPVKKKTKRLVYVLHLLATTSLNNAQRKKNFFEEKLNRKVFLLKSKDRKYYVLGLIFENRLDALKERVKVKRELKIYDAFITAEKISTDIFNQ